MVAANDSSNIEKNVEGKRAERAHAQKKIFTKWINSRLKQSRVQVMDVTKDFQDGQKLCTLLEVLTDSTIKGVVSKKLRTFKLQNVNKALDFLKKHKVELHNIGAEDIVDGNEKLILALIWNIILKFQIQDILQDTDITSVETNKASESSTSVDASEVKSTETKTNAASDQAKQSYQVQLKSWANEKLSTYNISITNFDSCWSDGMAFCAILHKYRPELIYFDSLKKTDKITNLETAFTTAERHLGVFKLLEPEDFLSDVDQKCVLMYLSMLFKALEKSSSAVVDESPLQRLVSQSKKNYEAQERLESDMKQMMEWLNDKTEGLGAFCYPSSLAAVDALIAETQNFCTDELLKKYQEIVQLQKRSSELIMSFRMNHQKLEISKTHSTERLNTFWTNYKTAFCKHQIEIGRRLKLYQELEIKVDQYNRQFDQRKMWILETRSLMSRDIAEEDLHSLEKLKDKFGLLKKEMDLFKPRVDHLVSVCDDLERVGYFDVASIKYKKFEILQLWNSLIETFEAKYRDLLAKIKEVQVVNDVVFMKTWKTQIETQLSTEFNACMMVELQTALKMISFAEANLQEYKLKCDEIISTGKVVRNGNVIQVEVSDELKEYLLADLDDLFELAAYRKEEMTLKERNLHLYQQKAQIEAWMQNCAKKISDDESKQLVQCINAGLTGTLKPYMKHNANKFKSIMSTNMQDYEKRKAELTELIQFCKNAQDEGGDESVDSELSNTKDALEDMMRQINEWQTNLSSDVESLMTISDLVIDYNQQKQKMKEIMLSGDGSDTTQDNIMDLSEEDSIGGLIDQSLVGSEVGSIGKEKMTEDSDMSLDKRVENLSTTLNKLMTHLKASEQDIKQIGVIDLQNATVSLQDSYQEVKIQIDGQSDNLKASLAMKNLRNRMEALAIWVDDRVNDIGRETMVNKPENTESALINRQRMIACEAELAKLIQDETNIASNWEKLKDFEQQIRQLQVADQEKSELVTTFKNLQKGMSGLESEVGRLKSQMQKMRQISGILEETSKLFLSLDDMMKMLNSISKNSDMSNEEIMMLRKRIADFKKQVVGITEKLSEKEASFESISLPEGIDMSQVHTKFAQVQELKKSVNEKISGLESDFKELSNVENFEISFYDLKSWTKSTLNRLEDMSESRVSDDNIYRTYQSYLDEVNDEMVVRQKEFDYLEQLKSRIEQNPAEKAKLAPLLKSFKKQRNKMKNIEAHIAKIRPLLVEYSKSTQLIMNKMYLDMMVKVMDACFSMEIIPTSKREAEYRTHRVSSLLDKEHFMDNKLKSLIEQFSAVKFSQKKQISEMRNETAILRKKLAAVVKKGRKELKQLNMLSEQLQLWDSLNEVKRTMNSRNDVQALYKDMKSSDMGEIDFESFCKVTRLEITRLLNSAEELREQGEKLKRKNQLNLGDYFNEIETLKQQGKEIQSKILDLIRDERQKSKSSPLSDHQTVSDSFQFKLQSLMNWQAMLQTDLNNVDHVTSNKSLMVILRSEFSESTSAKVESKSSSDNSDDASRTRDIAGPLLIKNLDETVSMIDSEFNDWNDEISGDVPTEEILSQKELFLVKQNELTSHIKGNQDSNRNDQLIQDTVHIIKSKIDWMQSMRDDLVSTTEVSNKKWPDQLQKLYHLETDLVEYKSSCYDDVMLHFNALVNGEDSPPGLITYRELPNIFRQSLEELENIIHSTKLQISEKNVLFRASERCEQFLRWLMFHQGLICFVAENDQLSSDICSVSLLAASIDDMERCGEIELKSIENLIVNSSTSDGNMLKKEDAYDSDGQAVEVQTASADVTAIMKEKLKQVMDLYKQMISHCRDLLTRVDRDITTWEMKQILAEYRVWTQPADSFLYIEPDSITLDNNTLHTDQQLKSHAELFRLEIEGHTIECLKNSCPEMNEINPSQETELQSLAPYVMQFQGKLKKALIQSEAKCSMMQSLQMNEHAAEYCKFFLERLYLMTTYMGASTINALLSQSGSENGIPTNKTLLLVELMRSQCQYLWPKAEESRLLVKQINSMRMDESKMATYTDFLHYHVKVRDDYDKLSYIINASHAASTVEVKNFIATLNTKEVVKLCYSIVYQIKVSPPPKNYYECIIQYAGNNGLRNLFPELMSEAKKNLEAISDLGKGSDDSDITLEAVKANTMLRAEWEMTSEILTCELEMCDFVYNTDISLNKMRKLRSIALSCSKDSPTSNVNQCITLEILNGYKSVLKHFSLKVEDKGLIDLLNKRQVDISQKTDAIRSKMKKTVRKNDNKDKKKRSVSDSKGGSDEVTQKRTVIRMDDCRMRFTLESIMTKEESRNPDKNSKYLGKQNYLLGGLYILPDDLKNMQKACEQRTVDKKNLEDIDIELSSFYPEFRMYIFKNQSKATNQDCIFTFNLADLTVESKLNDNLSQSIDVTLKTGTRMVIETATMQQYCSWLSYLELIQHVTTSKKPAISVKPTEE